jgi:hypothetical protein
MYHTCTDVTSLLCSGLDFSTPWHASFAHNLSAINTTLLVGHSCIQRLRALWEPYASLKLVDAVEICRRAGQPISIEQFVHEAVSGMTELERRIASKYVAQY